MSTRAFCTAALLLAALGCQKKPDPSAATSASAQASAAPAVPQPPTEQDLQGLSHLKAKEVLVSMKFRGSHANTGPEDGAFSIRTSSKEDDKTKAEIVMLVFTNEQSKELSRPKAVKDAAFVEAGMRLLSVKLKKADAPDEKAAKELLDALVKRGKDPAQPFTEMELDDGAWLFPKSEKVGKDLVIAPKLVEQLVAALEAQGYEKTSESQQKVDTSNESDTGHPGITLGAKKGDDTARLGVRCVREDTQKSFFPTLEDADLGEAIFVKERCKLTVGVKGADASMADRAKSKELFDKLVAYKPE